MSGQALAVRKPPKLPPNAITGTDDDYDFCLFWSIYPRKDDKGHARIAWRKALKKAAASVIIAGLQRYPFKPSKDWQPMPSTWLNGERWLAAAEQDTFDPVLRAAGLSPGDFND